MSSVVMCVDPGTEQSAYVVLDGDEVLEKDILPNEQMRNVISQSSHHLVIEMFAGMGMAVGKEVFETCVWIGRYMELSGGECTRVFRRDIKLHLCGQARAKDANIRQALLDRYGPGKPKAIGLKATPGPLYGFRSHLWAALAVGVYYQDCIAPIGGGIDAPS